MLSALNKNRMSEKKVTIIYEHVDFYQWVDVASAVTDHVLMCKLY